MEHREFMDQAETIIRTLLPRIPTHYAEGFEGTLIGGEFSMALEDLVYAVVEFRVELSPDEAATLRRLVSAMPERDVLLPKLDHAVVARGGPDR